MSEPKLLTAVFLTENGVHTNFHGFVDVRDVFNCAWFTGEQEIADRYMEYCSERNQKDNWTYDTVIDQLCRMRV